MTITRATPQFQGATKAQSRLLSVVSGLLFGFGAYAVLLPSCAHAKTAAAQLQPAAAQERLLLTETTIALQLPPGAEAFNGSMVRYNGRLLLAYRQDHKDARGRDWMQLAIVPLNEHFQPSAAATILETRSNEEVAPTAEDPRLFVHNGALYVVYNSTADGRVYHSRREMYLMEIGVCADGDIQSEKEQQQKFSVQQRKKLRLAHGEGLFTEKNWTPFSYGEEIHFLYASNPPHTVRLPDAQWQNDIDTAFVEEVSQDEQVVPEPFGRIRGGSPLIFDEQSNRFFSFFHTRKLVQRGQDKHQAMYLAGLASYDAKPPFSIRELSSTPIVPSLSYNCATAHKWVIYPTGFVRDGSVVHMSYGRNDKEIGVVTLSWPRLLQLMLPADPHPQKLGEAELP